MDQTTLAAHSVNTSLGRTLALRYRVYRDRGAALQRHAGESVKRYEKQLKSFRKVGAKIEAVPQGEAVQLVIEGKQAVELTSEQYDVLRLASEHAVDSTAAIPPLVVESAFVYHCAMWDALILEQLAATVRARPQLLSTTKKQLTFESVVAAGSWDAVLESMLERELYAYGYLSVSEQLAFFTDRMGVTMADKSLDAASLVELRARRNLFVHNDGVVNRQYISTASSSGLSLGARASIDYAYLEAAEGVLSHAAGAITIALINKYCGGLSPDLERIISSVRRVRDAE